MRGRPGIRWLNLPLAGVEVTAILRILERERRRGLKQLYPFLSLSFAYNSTLKYRRAARWNANKIAASLSRAPERARGSLCLAK